MLTRGQLGELLLKFANSNAVSEDEFQALLQWINAAQMPDPMPCPCCEQDKIAASDRNPARNFHHSSLTCTVCGLNVSQACSLRELIERYWNKRPTTEVWKATREATAAMRATVVSDFRKLIDSPDHCGDASALRGNRKVILLDSVEELLKLYS